MAEPASAPPISGPMAAALAAERDRCNGLVQQARRSHPQLDLAAFGVNLADFGQPVVDAAEAALPGSAPAVTAAVFEALLELSAKNLMGEPAVATAWRVLLLELAPVLAAEPAAVVGPIVNALWNLTSMPGPRADEWVERMQAVGGVKGLDAAALLAAGAVAAWRSGLAHGRAAALTAARTLDPAVVWAALGLGAVRKADEVAAVLDRLTADRWAGLKPDEGERQLGVVARVGSFRGFGGQFVVPPRVGVAGDQLVAIGGDGQPGGEEFWAIHADRFGATMTRRDRPEPGTMPVAPAYAVNDLGHVTPSEGGRAGYHLHEAEAPTSSASTTDTLAVTTGRSFSVLLVAELEP